MIARLARRFARSKSVPPHNRAIISLESLSERITPADCEWVGDPLGITNAFEEDNWKDGNVPEPGDNIYVPKNSGKGMVFSNGPILLGSVVVEDGWSGLIIGTDITIQGNSIIYDTGFGVDGKLEFANGATILLRDNVDFLPANALNPDPGAYVLVAPATTLVVESNSILKLGLNTTNNGIIRAYGGVGPTRIDFATDPQVSNAIN